MEDVSLLYNANVHEFIFNEHPLELTAAMTKNRLERAREAGG